MTGESFSSIAISALYLCSILRDGIPLDNRIVVCYIGAQMTNFRFWASLQIAAVMVGAIGVNLWVLHVPTLACLTAILMVLALVLAWLRRPQRG
jgi:hypothetical protein